MIFFFWKIPRKTKQNEIVKKMNFAIAGPPHGKIVSCALSVQSQQMESESQFVLENANLFLCTHLIYIDRSALTGEGTCYRSSTNFQLIFTLFHDLTGIQTYSSYIFTDAQIHGIRETFPIYSGEITNTKNSQTYDKTIHT